MATLKREDFQMWGALGGRMRARRLTKARRREIARIAGSSPKTSRGRPMGSINQPKTDHRIEKMAALFRSGKTLQEVGGEFGLTRERVRQLFLKMDYKINGGASVKSLMRERANIETRGKEKDRQSLDVFGCSYAELLRVQGSASTGESGTPSYAYNQHKSKAQVRNIEWKFTLKTWWKLWEESGKWSERGRGAGKYCMARNGDIGPYSPENVRIITNSENAIESYSKHPMENRMALVRGNKISILTAREQEIYDLCSRGLRPAEVSRKLGIARGTVTVMMNHAKHKLGLL